MDAANASLSQMATTSKQIGRQLLTIGGNRLELLMVELEEERDRLLRAVLLTLAGVACGLLAGIALTFFIVIAFWDRWPMGVLGLLAIAYGIAAAVLFAKLNALRKDWHTLPATLEQLRKDRECLEKLT